MSLLFNQGFPGPDNGAGGSAGKKYDGRKSPALQGLLAYFPHALLAVGMQSKYGAEKYELDYADKNWEKVEGGVDRYGNAIVRHLIDEQIDGLVDPESEMLHAQAVAWNALARLELLLTQENNLA